MSARAGDLAAVLRALKQLELAKLAQAAKNKNDVRKKIQRLGQARYTALSVYDAVGDMSAFDLADVGDSWNRWIDGKTRAHNMELAMLAAKFEERKTRARLALGRQNAFDRLLERKSSARSGQYKHGY